MVLIGASLGGIFGNKRRKERKDEREEGEG